MARLNSKGYVERSLKKKGRPGSEVYVVRRNCGSGLISISFIRFNKSWIGKKVRIKISEVKQQ